MRIHKFRITPLTPILRARMAPRTEPNYPNARPGQRPPEAWSFMPPYREKPLPEKFRSNVNVHFATPVPPTGPMTLSRPGHTVLCRGAWNILRDWSLVLASQQIPHHFEQSPEGPWFLEVIDNRAHEAAHQLLLYREENPEKPPHAPLPPLRWSAQPLWVLLIPVVGSFWQSTHAPAFERLGIANAERIVDGEWWRIFTALTLHADSAHLASNLLSGFLVLALLALRLPLSRIVPFLVLAAGLANLGVAYSVGADFRSLGFSTFVFTALGALGTLEWRIRPKESGGLIRRFAPWFGVLTLAILTGLSENSDILAHFYGLAAGWLAGFLPSRRQLQWGSPLNLSDALIALGTLGFFVLVWLKALGQLPTFA